MSSLHAEAAIDAFRFAATSVREMISVHDLEGRYRYASPACKRITGYNPDELQGRLAYEFFVPDDLDAIRDSHAGVLREEVTRVVQYRFCRRNGELIWVESHSRICPDLDEGTGREIVSVTRELARPPRGPERARVFELELDSELTAHAAALERVQSELSRTQQLLHLLYEHSPALLFTYDWRREHNVQINQQTADFFGVPLEEPERIDRKLIIERLHPDDLAVLAEGGAALSTACDRAPVTFELRMRNAAGEYRWLSWRQVVIERQSDGVPALVLGTGLDLTEIRQAQEQIARLATAVEQTPDALYLTDADFVIQYVNPAFTRVTGYPAAEAIGHSADFLASPLLDAGVLGDIRRTLSAGKAWCGRHMHLRKDGSQYEALETQAPFRAPDGRVTGYAAILRDVTEEAELQAQLRQAQKMETLGQLAAGVAHDFNNLLTVIFGYVSLAESAVPEHSAAAAAIRRAEEAAIKAGELTKALLALGRRRPPHRAPVELGALTTQALLERTLPPSIILEQEPAPGPLWVEADPAQLHQVLMNLIVNARDALPEGGSIRVGLRPTADEGEALLIVRDDGAGMSPEVRDRVFEPFFTTKTGDRGTGLGLAIVRRIVEEHGGAISLDTAPGQGATFQVRLPATQAAAPPAAELGGPLPRGGGQRVLIAEEQPAVRHIISSALRSLGYDPATASTGPAFLAAAERDGYDAYVVAVELPERSGIACLRTLRAAGRVQPALLVAAGAAPTIDDDLQPSQTLPKPFRLPELARAMSELLAAATDGRRR